MKTPTGYAACLIAKNPRRNKSITYDSNKENPNRTLSPAFSNGSYQIEDKFQKRGHGLLEKSFNSTNMSKQKDMSIFDLGKALEKMEDYQQFCAKEFKLKEGQEAKEKVTELKQEIMQKTKYQIEEKYNQEMEILMVSQVNEMNEFNEFWDQKVKEFEEQASSVENEMLLKQKHSLIIKEDELRRGITMKRRASSQYLSYRKSFENLVKQKEFVEAERIKAVCEEYERAELSKAYNEKEYKIKASISLLDQKHKNELNVLRKKLSTKREELMRARVSELEKFLLKFQNARNQLEQEHQFELTRLELANKTYRIGFDEISARSSCKTSTRTSRRPSKSTLRLRDPTKLNSLNMSTLSPMNNTVEFRPFDHVSLSVKNGNHKRNKTNEIKGFKIVEVTGLLSPGYNFRPKRANSVIRR
jgi:hypothetical protein